MCGPAAPTRWACAQTTTDTAGLIKGDLTFQSGHVQGFQKGTACTRHFKCALKWVKNEYER